MESVCGSWPGREYDCCVQLGSRYRMSGHVPVIHRSICSDLLYCPGPAEGRMYDPELFCLYFYVVVGRAAVRPELPRYPDRVVVGPPHCPDRVVVGQPHYVREVWAPTPLHRTEVAICASGNSWLGV